MCKFTEMPFFSLREAWIFASENVLHTGGGGSSIVKVPGDVPPTRVYFLDLESSQGYTFWQF